jgi:hypothetical protein
METAKEGGKDLKNIPKDIWNTWVLDNKDKIQRNSNYRIISKFKYIFLIFVLGLFLLFVFLIGIWMISDTGNFKSIINNTNLCTCPSIIIPQCPSINCPDCPITNCNCSINIPNNLNITLRNST